MRRGESTAVDLKLGLTARIAFLAYGHKGETLANPLVAQWGSFPDDSKLAWLSFVDHFERFTSVLCAAAHLGCSEEHEREFAHLRQWFAQHYGAVAHRIRPSLILLAPDLDGQSDPFEALLRPDNLRDLLQQDRGDLIPRIATISECVYDVPLA